MSLITVAKKELYSFIKGSRSRLDSSIPRRWADGKLRKKVGKKWVTISEEEARKVAGESPNAKKPEEAKSPEALKHTEAQYLSVAHASIEELERRHGISEKNAAEAKRQAGDKLKALEELKKKVDARIKSKRPNRKKKPQGRGVVRDAFQPASLEPKTGKPILERSYEMEAMDSAVQPANRSIRSGKAEAPSKSKTPVTVQNEIKTEEDTKSDSDQNVREVKISDIYESEQIRKETNEGFSKEKIEKLANSIKKHGLLLPPVVRADGKGKFEMVDGGRRLRAVKLLVSRGEWPGGENLTVTVKEGLSDKKKDIQQWVGNKDREANTPGEDADHVKKMMENHDMSVKEIAELSGESNQYIRGLISITRLHPEIRKELDRGHLKKTSAVLLGGLNYGQQLRAYSEMQKRNMTVNMFQGYIQDLRTQGSFFSEDEGKTDEMRRAGRALGGKSPEKLQGKFESLMNKHQKTLNNFLDSDGSQLSALALAATGEFDSAMDRLKMMESQLARIMSQMQKHRNDLNAGKGQTEMFKSALVDFRALRRSLFWAMSRETVAQFVNAGALYFLKNAGHKYYRKVGEGQNAKYYYTREEWQRAVAKEKAKKTHAWMGKKYDKETHNWKSIKKEIRNELDRLNQKGHIRANAQNEGLARLRRAANKYQAILDAGIEDLQDNFQIPPERASEAKKIAEEKLNAITASQKKRTRMEEDPDWGEYLPKNTPASQVLRYREAIQDFLEKAHSDHINQTKDAKVRQFQEKIDNKEEKLEAIQKQLEELENEEKSEENDEKIDKLEEEADRIKTEIEALVDRIEEHGSLADNRIEKYNDKLNENLDDLSNTSESTFEKDIEDFIDAQDAVMSHGRVDLTTMDKKTAAREMVRRKKILNRITRKSRLATLISSRESIRAFIQLKMTIAS